jgi:hypothetical protein
LYEFLLLQGFQEVERRYDDAHNRLVVLEHEECRVRLVAHRGEWSIAVSLSGREWIHPDVWESYLDDFPLAGDLSDLDHQVQFLKRRLDELRRHGSAEVEAELLRTGEEYMRRRLGSGRGKRASP